MHRKRNNKYHIGMKNIFFMTIALLSMAGTANAQDRLMVVEKANGEEIAIGDPVVATFVERGDPNEGWTSLGHCLYGEDLIGSVVHMEYYGDMCCEYYVEVQEKDDEPGMYRLVDPYSPNTYPYGEYCSQDTEEDHYYLVIDATDPDKVTFGLQDMGITFGTSDATYSSSFRLYVWGSASWCLHYGYPESRVEQEGTYGTLKDGVITFPESGVIVAINGMTYVFANNYRKFKVDLNDRSDTAGAKAPESADEGDGDDRDYDMVVENADGETTSIRVRNIDEVRLPGNTWTAVARGDYAYAQLSEYVDRDLELFRSDAQPNRWKIAHWGGDVDLDFTYDEETGEVFVDLDQQSGLTHNGADLLVGEWRYVTGWENVGGLSRFDSGTNIFNFCLAYYNYPEEFGYMRTDFKGVETFTITELYEAGDSAQDGQEDGASVFPNLDIDLSQYDGRTATDADMDAVGTDEDLYWEANSFTDEVRVTFSGDGATVETSNGKILSDVQGAYVTIDMLTNSVKNARLTASGESPDGQLKIYGDKKFMLVLDGLDLACSRGPAINDQCKKRAFVHLEDGTSNSLEDAASYSAEPYYFEGSSENDEDRKGCLFSEGNLIFSGTGTLRVKGNNKHGIATDGCLHVRPGATIVVTDAVKNAIHAKGDDDDGYGIRIAGGLVYAATSGTAGKGMKTDGDAVVTGGELYLYTSGGSEYDEDENDTSSPAGIKADGDIIVSGGSITAQSVGTGGKGFSADGRFTMDDGSVEILTTGAKFTYTQSLTSSPKGIKADGDVEVNGGCLDICAIGASDGSEGLESKSNLTINGGDVRIYAYDDALNGSSSVTINGGRVFCYGVNNDGIDSNGSLTINGGLVIASGTTAPEEGIDCDSSSRFLVNGGTVIGTGGTTTAPSSSSGQRVVLYNGFQGVSGNLLSILDGDGKPVLAYELPRTMSSMCLFFSSPDLADGTYTVVSGGEASGFSDQWCGWHSGGEVTGGETLGTFTSRSTITTVGTGGGTPGGDIPGGGGNNPGGDGNNPGGGNPWR